ESKELTVYTDSKYVVSGVTEWVSRWKNRGWKTVEGEDVKNRALWEELYDLVQKLKSRVTIQWVRVAGHSGIPGNERCDEIAVAFAKNQEPHLFQGDLTDYQVDLTDLEVK